MTNGEGCTATASDTIRLYTLSVSTISGDNEICLGESTTLTAAPDAEHTAASYEWIGIAGANTNEVTVSPVADSIFRVRVVDNNGCYDTAKITITVDTLPTATITASATTVCQDGTLELSADNAGSGLTYLWKDGYVTVTNDYGCTATANDTIKQPEELTIEVTAITQIACSYSGNMGSITVEAHGGKTPTYTYVMPSWCMDRTSR